MWPLLILMNWPRANSGVLGTSNSSLTLSCSYISDQNVDKARHSQNICIYVPKSIRHLGQCGSLSGYILDKRTGVKYPLWRISFCISLSPAATTNLGPASRHSSLSRVGISVFHTLQSLSICGESVVNKVPYSAERGFPKSLPDKRSSTGSSCRTGGTGNWALAAWRSWM